ncbi:hypothetical protein BJX65DRAFT_264730, partial [Aspergillus insuetus]
MTRGPWNTSSDDVSLLMRNLLTANPGYYKEHEALLCVVPFLSYILAVPVTVANLAISNCQFPPTRSDTIC